MIRLSVPATFNKGVLELYVRLNKKYRDIKICEVYGSLQSTPSARETKRLFPVTEKRFFDYVRDLKNEGIEFNYTFNSTTITEEYIEKFARRVLEELWEKGINILTIASPLLIEYIRRNLSHLKFYIVASTIIGIDSIQRIKQVIKFGVNRITLDIRCNRNFKFLYSLKEIKKIEEFEFEILVNEFCGDCTIRNIHYNLESLDASSYLSKDKFLRDYPFNVCTQLFLIHPKNILKNYWILPDWMRYYYEICKIDWFKITGRTIKNIKWHKFIVKEYMKQQYKGNILDLGPLVIGDLKHEGSKSKVYLDADIIKKKNYIEYFIKNTPDCLNICGIKCNFCETLS